MRYNILITLFIIVGCQGMPNTPQQANWIDDYLYDPICTALSWTQEKAAQAIFGCAQMIQQKAPTDLTQLKQQKEDYETQIKAINHNLVQFVHDLETKANIKISSEMVLALKKIPTKTDTESYNILLETYTKELTKEQDNFTATYGALCKPNILLSCLRYSGYATALIVGCYTGNILYNHLLKSYFTQHTSRADLIKKITELEETYERLLAQCAENNELLEQATENENKELSTTLAHLKTQVEVIKEELAKLNEQLSSPQQPSAMRKLVGTTVRFALITATAYLFYAAFEKLDTAYLYQKSLTQDEEKLFAEKIELEKLLKEKQSNLDHARLLLHPDNKYIFDNLISQLEQKFRFEKALQEIVEKLKEIPQEQQAQVLANMVNPPYRGI